MVEPRLPKGAHIIVKIADFSCWIKPGISQSMNVQLSHHSYLTENDEDIPEEAARRLGWGCWWRWWRWWCWWCWGCWGCWGASLKERMQATPSLDASIGGAVASPADPSADFSSLSFPQHLTFSRPDAEQPSSVERGGKNPGRLTAEKVDGKRRPTTTAAAF